MNLINNDYWVALKLVRPLGSESLKGGSEEAPGSPVEAPRNSRFAILPRVWWLSKVHQDLQIPGCREHVLPTGATA